MYHKHHVGKLSTAQISKLLNGHAVRVKHGNHHEVHLSVEQSKKVHKAHSKGKAVQIRFDPYQIQHHQHLRGKSHGGSIKDDMANFYNNKIPSEFHPGLESLGNASLKLAGFGVKRRGRPRKSRGGSIKDDMANFYNNKIPSEFHPGLESLGNASLKLAGFGLKKRGRPRKMHGQGFWDDISNAFHPADNAFKNTFTPELGKQIARGAIQYGIPAAVGGLTSLSGNPEFAPLTSGMMSQLTPQIQRSVGLGLRKKKGGSLMSKAMNAVAPVAAKVLKPVAKKVAHQVIKYGAAAAGPAAAAATAAIGQPELAPMAAMMGNYVAREKAATAHKYIDGLGLKKRRGRAARPMKGSALMAAGY